MERTRKRIGLKLRLEEIKLDLTKLKVREVITIGVDEFRKKKKKFKLIEEYLAENSFRGIVFSDIPDSHFLAVARVGGFARAMFLDDLKVADSFSECPPIVQGAIVKEFNEDNIFTIESLDGKPIFKFGALPIVSHNFKFVKPYGQELFLFERSTNFHNGFPTSPKNPERLVTCAGGISFIDGKISDIDNNSGHFCPDAPNNIINTIKVLAKMLPTGIKLIDCFDEGLIDGENLVFKRNYGEKDYIVPIAVVNAISERYSQKRAISSR